MEVRLFTYGTLTRRRRLEALTGTRLGEPEAALLEGFAYVPTPRGYPIILPRDGAQVNGWVWTIREEDLQSLDHYEGTDEEPPYYTRREVEVRLDRGGTVKAWVYVGNPEIPWSIVPDREEQRR